MLFFVSFFFSCCGESININKKANGFFRSRISVFPELFPKYEMDLVFFLGCKLLQMSGNDDLLAGKVEKPFAYLLMSVGSLHFLFIYDQGFLFIYLSAN